MSRTPRVALLAALLSALSPGSASAQLRDPLLQGASTFVPYAAHPQYRDLDGQPFTVDTRITAVQFHSRTRTSRS